MAPKFSRHRFRLLLDENIPQRQRLTRLNRRYNVKHLRDDLNMGGVTDSVVVTMLKKLHRILITTNDKHFYGIPENCTDYGVIGISANMTAEQIDRKIAAFLAKRTEKQLYGKFIYISNETKV